MDIESAKTIVEAVKMFGPAIIGALVAIKVGKLQMEAKIKELEKLHAYSASEKLFDYYKNREKELNESYNRIKEDMGFLLGMNLALTKDDDSLNKIIKMYDFYKKTLPDQIKQTLRAFKKNNLQETEEFRKLEDFQDQKLLQDQAKNLSDKVFNLLEIYSYLKVCNNMILEEISTNYMKKFVNSSKSL